MRISTRSEYGLRALMELGIETRGALSLRDIATRQNISLDYLEQIMPALKSAGLIQARRGAQGGYQLAKPASEITTLDVLSALEGSLDPMACLSSQPPSDQIANLDDTPKKAVADKNAPVLDTCGASGSCAVQEVWREVKTAMETVLRQLTLAELIERQEARYGGPIRTYSEHEIMKLVVLN
jgi:Rrf2 family protein